MYATISVEWAEDHLGLALT